MDDDSSTGFCDPPFPQLVSEDYPASWIDAQFE